MPPGYRCASALALGRDGPPCWSRGMNIELGLLGAHLREHEVNPERAVQVERAGYGTLWLDASPPADLALAEELLDATTRLAVGTSVVNVWTADADTVAASYHRIEAKHPGRLLLGV